MIFNVVKTYKNEHTGELKKMCKRSILRQTAIMAAAVAVELLLFFYLDKVWQEADLLGWLLLVPTVLFGLCYLSMLCLGLPNVLLASVDWLDFANNHTLIPLTIKLSKWLETGDKEISDVVLKSGEIRAKDKNGSIALYNLGKKTTFMDEFEFQKNPDLASDEMILDLRGKKPFAYVADVSYVEREFEKMSTERDKKDY